MQNKSSTLLETDSSSEKNEVASIKCNNKEAMEVEDQEIEIIADNKEKDQEVNSEEVKEDIQSTNKLPLVMHKDLKGKKGEVGEKKKKRSCDSA